MGIPAGMREILGLGIQPRGGVDCSGRSLFLRQDLVSGHHWGLASGMGSGHLSPGRDLEPGQGHRDSDPTRAGCPGRRAGRPRGSHLLLVRPFLAGPRALAALLLDSHHEAPMLARDLGTRRPGDQMPESPHPDGQPGSEGPRALGGGVRDGGSGVPCEGLESRNPKVHPHSRGLGQGCCAARPLGDPWEVGHAPGGGRGQ